MKDTGIVLGINVGGREAPAVPADLKGRLLTDGSRDPDRSGRRRSFVSIVSLFSLQRFKDTRQCGLSFCWVRSSLADSSPTAKSDAGLREVGGMALQKEA